MVPARAAYSHSVSVGRRKPVQPRSVQVQPTPRADPHPARLPRGRRLPHHFGMTGSSSLLPVRQAYDRWSAVYDVYDNPMVSAAKDDTLAMTMVAKTFRYLDEAEVAKQKRDKAAQAKGAKGAPGAPGAAAHKDEKK